MATVDKNIADQIVAGKFASDEPTRIVEYDNAWGGKAYGVTFKGQDINTYMRSTEYVRNPKVYWDHANN